MKNSKPISISIMTIFLFLLAACGIGVTRPVTPTPNVPSQTVVVPLPTETQAAPSIPTPNHTPFPLPSSTPDGRGVVDPAWETYQDSIFGFEIRYPPGSMGGNQSGEVRFYLPILPGTNLGEKYLILAARKESAACSGETYLGFSPDETPPETVTLAGVEFAKEAGYDVGAGNIYDHISYSTSREGACVSLIFVMHSTNTQNYENPPAEFDWDKETEIFERIVSTFKWTP